MMVLSAQSDKYFNKGLNWVDIHNAKKILQKENGGYVFASSAKNTTANMWKPYFVETDGQGDILFTIDIAPDSLQGRLDDLCMVGQNYFVAGALFLNEITPWKMCVSSIDVSSYNFINYTLGDECQSKFAEACASTETGDIFAAGYNNIICLPGRFLYLVKLAPTGAVLLDTTYTYFSPAGFNWIQDIAATPDGGAYLLATINYAGDTGDIALIKIDSLGNWQWHQVYNPTTTTWLSRDLAGHVITTSDGGVLMSYIADKPNIALRVNYVHKLNSLHQTEWIIDAFCRGGGGPSLIQLADSSYFVAGSYYLDDGLYNKNAEILKLSSFGELLWRRQFGGNGDDYLYDAIVQNHDYSGKSGYVLCGRTESNTASGAGADAWLVRVNCMGLLTEPEADFLALPYPSMPQTIAFANQSLYVYPDSTDGGHYILDWGDGSPPLLCGQGFEPCSGSLPTHTYQSSGLYPVTLQAIVCNDTSALTRAVCIGFDPEPQAAFSHEILDYTVLFTNLSQNAYSAQGGYYSWDFGDGSPPVSEEHPVHTYPDNGSFTVTLTLMVCQDTSVYTETIAIAKPVGISPEKPLPEGAGSVSVFPNPAQNALTFAINYVLSPPSGGRGVTGDLGVTLYNLTGQLVLQTTFVSAGSTNPTSSTNPTDGGGKTISVAHLPEGMYLYSVEQSGMVLARGKVAVVR